MPKEDNHCVCLSVNLIYSILKMGKKYFPQVPLEDFEFIQKVKKVIRYITDDLEVSLDDSGGSHKKWIKHYHVFLF